MLTVIDVHCVELVKTLGGPADFEPKIVKAVRCNKSGHRKNVTVLRNAQQSRGIKATTFLYNRAMSEDPGATRTRFEEMFETIAAAMKSAAKEADHSIAASEVERFGFTKTAPTKQIGEAWQTTENGFTLWFQWRYYDQSKLFSVQKDMNIMSLELREGGNAVRKAEERFED